jgi:hypothetical protein
VSRNPYQPKTAFVQERLNKQQSLRKEPIFLGREANDKVFLYPLCVGRTISKKNIKYSQNNGIVVERLCKII